MARYGQVDVNDTIACLMRERVASDGGEPWILFGIVAAESGFAPNAVGDRASGPSVTVGNQSYAPYRDPNGAYWCSLGLLQLNLCGGQGVGYSPTTLFDPRRNLEIGYRPIAIATIQAYQRGYTGERFIREIARSSGHPGFVPLEDARLTSIVNHTVRLITDSRGNLAPWPAYRPSDCGAAVPAPPPPIGSWAEGPAPANSQQADDAVHRHLERIGDLVDRF